MTISHSDLLFWATLYIVSSGALNSTYWFTDPCIALAMRARSL